MQQMQQMGSQMNATRLITKNNGFFWLTADEGSTIQ